MDGRVCSCVDDTLSTLTGQTHTHWRTYSPDGVGDGVRKSTLHPFFFLGFVLLEND